MSISLVEQLKYIKLVLEDRARGGSSIETGRTVGRVLRRYHTTPQVGSRAPFPGEKGFIRGKHHKAQLGGGAARHEPNVEPRIQSIMHRLMARHGGKTRPRTDSSGKETGVLPTIRRSFRGRRLKSIKKARAAGTSGRQPQSRVSKFLTKKTPGVPYEVTAKQFLKGMSQGGGSRLQVGYGTDEGHSLSELKKKEPEEWIKKQSWVKKSEGEQTEKKRLKIPAGDLTWFKRGQALRRSK